MMNESQVAQQDDQLMFLQELIEEKATVAADITRIGTHTWAIHGVIPVDGDVIMAEFDTYCEARGVLDQLYADGSHTT